jgi:hypothetical protein
MSENRRLGDPAPEQSKTVDGRVLTAIVNAYYPRVLASAEAARTRAQSAYAIASAIAGALVIALITSKSQTASTAAKVLGIVALAAWLAATMLYIWAVAAPLQSQPAASTENADSFVTKALDDVERQRIEVDHLQLAANLTAILAMVLTTAAFSFLFFDTSAADPRSPGTLVLTPQGLHAVKQVCPGATRTLTGLVDRTTLEGHFVSLSPNRNTCPAELGSLRISREQVIAVRIDSG